MSRIIVDIPTNTILQVEKTPDIGVTSELGGRYVIPVPDGTGFDYADLPGSPGPQDIADQLAAKLLARFPMYENITYNFLLDATDVLDLDLSAAPAVSAVGGFTAVTRVQTGRGAGTTGQVPTTTALLPVNVQTSPNKPGMLITDTIDIAPVTGGAGADEFLVWWQIYEIQVGADTASDYGVFAGANLPAARELVEVDQEPAFFDVYISHDDGTTWTGPVGRIEPTDLGLFDTDVRLAFLSSNTTTKVFLAAYAILF